MRASNGKMSLAAIFDDIYSPRLQSQLSRLVVNVSVAGLFVHLMMVLSPARLLRRPQ